MSPAAALMLRICCAASLSSSFYIRAATSGCLASIIKRLRAAIPRLLCWLIRTAVDSAAQTRWQV
jgi:hypothetical protein